MCRPLDNNGQTHRPALTNWFMKRITHKITALLLAIALALPVQGFSQVLPYMPPVGRMITPAAKPYDLPYIVGMRFSSDNIFDFTFILNKGNFGPRKKLSAEAEKIGKYFFGGLDHPRKRYLGQPIAL